MKKVNVCLYIATAASLGAVGTVLVPAAKQGVLGPTMMFVMSCMIAGGCLVSIYWTWILDKQSDNFNELHTLAMKAVAQRDEMQKMLKTVSNQN